MCCLRVPASRCFPIVHCTHRPWGSTVGGAVAQNMILDVVSLIIGYGSLPKQFVHMIACYLVSVSWHVHVFCSMPACVRVCVCVRVCMPIHVSDCVSLCLCLCACVLLFHVFYQLVRFSNRGGLVIFFFLIVSLFRLWTWLSSSR
jgi:hypothetical protein